MWKLQLEIKYDRSHCYLVISARKENERKMLSILRNQLTPGDP